MVNVVKGALVVAEWEDVVVAQTVEDLHTERLGTLVGLTVDVTLSSLHGKVTSDRNYLPTGLYSIILFLADSFLQIFTSEGQIT